MVLLKVQLKRHGAGGGLYSFCVAPEFEVTFDAGCATTRELALVRRWFQEAGSSGSRPASSDPSDLSVVKEVEMSRADVGEILALRSPSFVAG